MLSWRAHGATLSVALTLLGACTPAPAAPPAIGPASSAAQARQLELLTSDDRPALGLVVRDGDPRAAMALAVSHDFGPEASLALARIVASRISKAGFANVATRPSGLGFVIVTLLGNPTDATRFVRAASTALSTPIAAGELGAAPPNNAMPAVRVWRGRADARVGACSGELGANAAHPPASPAGSLESWRQQLFSARAAAFAVVGPRPAANAARAALGASEVWPKTGGPNDAWPATDALGIDATPAGDGRVSVAYRAADAARVLEVARELGAPRSRLSARIGSLEPSWGLDRVVATTRPRGACLRLDLRVPRGASNASAADVARAIAVVDEEARAQVEARGDPWYLDDAALRPTDPRDAAAVAAWRALTGRLAGGPTRRFVSYAAPPERAGAKAESELGALLAKIEQEARASSVPRKVRVEAGQGELWALVASACGTLSESSDDAGVTALFLRTLAREQRGANGVELEAWTTPDGVGLLAHSARLDPNESADAQARRVGDALGRALVATRLDGSELASERDAMLAEIDRPGEKGWSLALDGVSGGHPSWLEPRGTVRSLAGVSAEAIEKTRHSLLSGPLRLAVLANASDAQAAAVGRGLERWLWPARPDPTACPSPGQPAARNGELDVEEAAGSAAHSFLAVPIPPDKTLGVPPAARATVLLLNRKGGWLERSLGAVPGGASAHATAVGGTHAAALVIEVDAANASQAATGEVRALLDRLAKGAITADDVEIARRAKLAESARQALDPRRRIVDLWAGRAADPPDLAALRRLSQSLGPASHLLVNTHPRE